MTAAVVSLRLTQLESVVREGLGKFMQVGEALLEIRDGRLYRERGFERFEDYCQEHFGFTRQRAHQLIQAAEAVNAVSRILDTGAPLPQTASHAEELIPLAKEDPALAAKVWQEVNEATNGHPTSYEIRDAVKRERNPAPTPEKPPLVNTRVSTSEDTTTERREQIRRLATGGYRSTALIAELVGLQPQRTANIIRDLGLPGEVLRRRGQIQRMVAEGYRDDQIADAVGLVVETLKANILEMGLPTQVQRIGRARRIDHNRAMSALIENCTPTPETLGVLDWSQLDAERFPEWDLAISTTIQTLTKLRNEIRKRLTEGTRGR